MAWSAWWTVLSEGLLRRCLLLTEPPLPPNQSLNLKSNNDDHRNKSKLLRKHLKQTHAGS